MLSVIVELNNVVVNFLLKWVHGRRKVLYISGSLLVLAGCATGFAAFFRQLPVGWLIAAFLLIGFPAGFFSFYSVIAKELNPPEVTGLAVAVLNFSAFACIALFGNISGFLLGFWKSVAKDGIFPREAYVALFVFLTAAALISAILGFFIPETGGKKNLS